MHPFAPLALALPHPLFSPTLAYSSPWPLLHGGPWSSPLDLLAPPPRSTSLLLSLASRLADGATRPVWYATQDDYTMRLRVQGALPNLTAEYVEDGGKIVLSSEGGARGTVAEIELPFTPRNPSSSIDIGLIEDELTIRLAKEKPVPPIPLDVKVSPQVFLEAEKKPNEDREEAAKTEEAELNDKFQVQAEAPSGESAEASTKSST